MKTITYKIIMVAVLLMLVFTIMAFKTSGTGQKYATMSVWELPSGAIYDSKIMIIYEDGQTEEFPLKTSKPSNWPANKTKITETLNSMATKGYELIAVDNSCYVFVKN